MISYYPLYSVFSNVSTPNILLVTKGHPFDRNAFFEIFDDINVDWTHVEHPAAQVFFDPLHARDYDAFVMYDMPGVRFGPEGPRFTDPTPEYKQAFLSLLESGQGMVFLHHALAGWPAWEEYSEIVGGRFLYAADQLRGTRRPDSGYRHKVNHQLQVLGEHPLTAGLPDSFPMTDELYLAEIFEDSVEPLITSDYSFTRENFYSANKAVHGSMFDNEGWAHEDGSNIVAWIKHYGQSPIAYLQGGDDPEAYANSNYRQLVENAIHWAASPAAHKWAQNRR